MPPATYQLPFELEDRGVYCAPFRVRGLPLYYAVDRYGNVIRSLLLRPAWSADALTAYLWRKLDRDDPMPRLALVFDVGAADPPDYRPMTDPVADDRRDRLRYVRAGAAKLRFYR